MLAFFKIFVHYRLKMVYLDQAFLFHISPHPRQFPLALAANSLGRRDDRRIRHKLIGRIATVLGTSGKDCSRRHGRMDMDKYLTFLVSQKLPLSGDQDGQFFLGLGNTLAQPPKTEVGRLSDGPTMIGLVAMTYLRDRSRPWSAGAALPGHLPAQKNQTYHSWVLLLVKTCVRVGRGISCSRAGRALRWAAGASWIVTSARDPARGLLFSRLVALLHVVQFPLRSFSCQRS